MLSNLNENYCVGVNRFAINGYFIFDKKDTLEIALKNNRIIYPNPDTEVLFVSSLGGMDLASIVEYDKLNHKVGIRYKGENFWFYTDPANVIMFWEEVNKLPEELIANYNKSELYILTEALSDLESCLDSYQVSEHKYLDKIKNNNDLLVLQKSINKIKAKFNDIFNYSQDKIEDSPIEEQD